MANSSIQKQYDKISSLYDHLSEGDDGIINFRLNAEKLLKDMPAAARVLDCSCGTGDHAIWASRQGFTVYASDISEGMLLKAKDKAARAKAKITFFISAWEDLHKNTKERFDLAMSPGNSFSHLAGFEMLDKSLAAIKKVMNPGGTFIFDIRNWEKTFKENSLSPQEFEIKNKQSFFQVRYSWDIKDWNTICKMHVHVSGSRKEDFEHFVFDFFPIGYHQLHDALLKAGFEKVERLFYADDSYYFVIAR